MQPTLVQALELVAWDFGHVRNSVLSQRKGGGAAGSRSSSSLADIASETLSPLGLALARLLLRPAYGKMLVLAAHHDAAAAAGAGGAVPVLPYAIALVASLSVPQLFLRPSPGQAIVGLGGQAGGGGA